MEGAGRMTKQEFMAMSFPYELKIINCEVETDFNTITGIMGDAYYISDSKYPYGDIVNCKPILHSLSDLTKEIEHNGEKFVPYKRLQFDIDCDGQIGNRIDWGDSHSGIIFPTEFLGDILKLIEWHFDIAGLIKKGEAIDINTLKINPYL